MDNNSTGACSYRIGEHVVYRSGGIYRIDDIRVENFCGIGERTYYVMSSVYDDNSMVYVPVDAQDIDKCLRHTLTGPEIDKLMTRAAKEQDDWEWVEDVKARAACYDELMSEGTCCGILRIFLSLRRHREEIEGSRKKLYASDARLLAASEKILTDEFSFILGIDKSDVTTYLCEEIEKRRLKAI